MCFWPTLPVKTLKKTLFYCFCSEKSYSGRRLSTEMLIKEKNLAVLENSEFQYPEKSILFPCGDHRTKYSFKNIFEVLLSILVSQKLKKKQKKPIPKSKKKIQLLVIRFDLLKKDFQFFGSYETPKKLKILSKSS